MRVDGLDLAQSAQAQQLTKDLGDRILEKMPDVAAGDKSEGTR